MVGRSLSLAALLFGAVLITLPALAAAALDGPPAPAPAARPLEPRMVGLEYMAGFADHWGDQRYARLAFMAQLEENGLLPLGTIAGIESMQAAAAASEPPPSFTYRDPHLVCDFTGDGVQDFVTNDYDFYTGINWVRGTDGSTGRLVWIKYDYYYVSHPDMTRRGMPLLQPNQDFFSIGNATGGGGCSLLLMSMTFSFRLGLVLDMTTRVELVHASRPYSRIWSRTFTATQTGFFIATSGTSQILDFPTGLVYGEGPAGKRWALKLTDFHFSRARDAVYSGCFLVDYRVSEDIYLGDLRTGAILWSQNLSFALRADRTNFTWMTGLADVAGDGEPELLMDQYYFGNPTVSAAPPTGNAVNQMCRGRDPMTGEQRALPPRGMGALALKGEDGSQLWYTVVHDDLIYRANLPAEESVQTMIWTHAVLHPDLTGDGKAEMMASWLSREVGDDPATPNGRFITHFMPINATNGKRLWGGSQSFQGWGFTAPVNAVANRTMPYIGFGIVDLPTPPAAGGRFPPKDVRMGVLRMTDGTPLWTYEAKFPQDSMASYHISLNQYLQALAPHDWNGDGIKELVTPSIYVPPKGKDQTLLSTAVHRYQVLDGASGDVITTITAQGPTGMVVGCGDDPGLTVVGGYGRRIAAHRFDVATGNATWSHILFNNPTPQAATASVELNFLMTKCTNGATDGRTMVSANMGLFSFKRGYEIQPMYGIVNATTELAWLVPELRGDVEGPGLIDLLDIPEPKLSEAETTALNLAPALPGIGAGAGLGLLHRRLRGGAK